MLVISRKPNESIVIGDRIVIEVLEISPSKIRLGIAAPDNVRIVRGELLPKPPLAEHLDRVRQNQGSGQDSIEIELPLGAGAGAGEAAQISEFNSQRHHSRATLAGMESSRAVVLTGIGASEMDSTGTGSTGTDSSGIGSSGMGSSEMGSTGTWVAAAEIEGEATLSQAGGRVDAEAIGPDGYRSGHSAGYTSSRPPRYDGGRQQAYDGGRQQGYGSGQRERAISCQAAREAWQASGRSTRSNSPRRDGSTSPPRANSRVGSNRVGAARVGGGDRSPTGSPSGYARSRGHHQPTGHLQPTWAEIAWSHLETMSREHHDELNEEAIAYQIVWQSWGSTAAPLGGSDLDTDIDPDHEIITRVPWQSIVS